MGLHQRHLVGRALHGEEARRELAVHKRDSHGSDIVMHVPESHQVEEDVQTAVSVVYVTLSQTFDGPASLSTLTGGPSSAAATTPVAAAITTSATEPTATSTALDLVSSSSSISLSPAESSYLAAQSAAQAVSTASSSATGLSTASASSIAATSSAVLMATATNVGARPAAATAAVVSNAAKGGMSGAAKAGLAIAIIVALVMAFGLIFFCWRRKKNANGQEEILNEKHASFADAGARSYEARHMQNSNNNSKRASVMTEKVPASIRSVRTTSTAPRLSLRPTGSFLPSIAAGAPQSGSAWERRPGNAQQNPFEDAAAVSEKQARNPNAPSNPFEDSQNANAAKKHSPQASWEGTEPPTPTSTKFGTASAVALAGAGAAGAAQASRGPNNVHRVQLDFKPSMEDEIELRSGQLVRMLHEYDDGWALCIRMDRSQQGVAPRTCLSKVPVKPRPQGPPGSSRPGTAGSMDSRPSMQSQRSVSPQEDSRGPSPEHGNVPNRKPVPGQAM